MSSKTKRIEGTCKWFNPKRGYGFISPADGSSDHFVHQSSIINQPGFRKLVQGQRVEYELKHDPDTKRVNAVEIMAKEKSPQKNRKPFKQKKENPTTKEELTD